MGGQIYEMIGPDGEAIAGKVGTSIYLALLQTCPGGVTTGAQLLPIKMRVRYDAGVLWSFKARVMPGYNCSIYRGSGKWLVPQECNLA
jgi:hypothetical protein